jgi:hypothetical protein
MKKKKKKKRERDRMVLMPSVLEYLKLVGIQKLFCL